MAQVFLALSVSVANRLSAEIQNALWHQIPFKSLCGKFRKNLERKSSFPVFLRDLANILQILNCFGHFCSKKRSGFECGSFCPAWECQFPVGSGETAFFSQILAFC